MAAPVSGQTPGLAMSDRTLEAAAKKVQVAAHSVDRALERILARLRDRGNDDMAATLIQRVGRIDAAICDVAMRAGMAEMAAAVLIDTARAAKVSDAEFAANPARFSAARVRALADLLNRVEDLESQVRRVGARESAAFAEDELLRSAP